MREIWKPDEKEKRIFRPEKGKLMLQDFYEHDDKTEFDVLSGSVLMFFDEVGEPGESWKTVSLARVVLNKNPNNLFNSGLLDVRSDVASYFDNRTNSEVISGEDMSLVIYRDVNELSLNRFLYGMARHFKWKRDFTNGNEIARKEMGEWYSLVKNLEGLLPEEKIRIGQVYRRIMRTWNDVGLWERINGAGKKKLE